MQGLLILIGIWLLDVVIKKVAANRKKQQQMPQYQPSNDADEDESEIESQESEPQFAPPRSLQDLIRQFENAQNEAEQGNIEPPTLPAPQPQYSDEPLTFRDIAEEVIELDVVDMEFLKDQFDLTEGEAITMLAELQKYRIIGRDMGDGEHDVLVHDLIELNNLLNHDKPSQEQILEEAEAEEDDGLHQELERQRKLNELEGRAKSARESAASSSGFDVIEDPNASDDGTVVVARRAPLVSTRNIADVRKGFIWAKVLDEPRFKRRWSMQYR